MAETLINHAQPFPFRSFFGVCTVELAIRCWLGPLRGKRGDNEHGGSGEGEEEGGGGNVVARVIQHLMGGERVWNGDSACGSAKRL